MLCHALQLQKICCSVSAALPQKGQSEVGRRPLGCARSAVQTPPRKDGAKQRAFEL